MTPRSRWYGQAVTVIKSVILEAERLGLSPEATRTLVDAAYPFGSRKYWPYRQWLKARRELLDLGSPTGRAAHDRDELAAWQAGAPIEAGQGRPSPLEQYIAQQKEGS